MATNFVQDGRMLDYTNSTSAVITSGQVLAVGAVLGVRWMISPWAHLV
ncbi:DUF2190 family protein [Microbulbifer sp. VTAC004]